MNLTAGHSIRYTTINVQWKNIPADSVQAILNYENEKTKISLQNNSFWMTRNNYWTENYKVSN